MVISNRERSSAGRLATAAWIGAAAVALLAGALWLRAPEVRYLLIGGVATFTSLLAAAVTRPQPGHGAAAGGPRMARGLSLAAGSVLAILGLTAAFAQRDLARIDGRWEHYRADLVADGARRLGAELDATVAALRATASEALAAPDDPRRALDFLRELVAGHRADGGGGVVVFQDAEPTGWAGRIYATPARLDRPVGVVVSQFYVTIQAELTRGSRRAIATAVVHADSPADSLAAAVDQRVAKRSGLRGFRFVAGGGADTGVAAAAAPLPDPGDALVYAPLGDTLFRVHPLPPTQAEARVQALRRARVVGGALLGLALALSVAAVWRRESSVWWQLLPLGVALACLALAPLNFLSSTTFLFDPAVYFATIGGPFTASVGALILTSVVVLLGMFVVLRTRARARSRWAAIAIVLVVVGSGPFVLRILSRGISPPMEGVTAGLWLAWELALFFAGASLLLGAATAGSAALGPRRGLPAAAAPLLAAAAAAFAPWVLEPPARWPDWYAVLWIVAIGALALTRRHRAILLSVATVAALGATTLAWRADVGARMTLATRDVAALDQERPEVVTTLARLGERLADGAPLTTGAALLHAYARSDLEGSGYPVSLASWSPGDEQIARLALAPATVHAEDFADLRGDVRARGAP
ncbi:MAG: hypothetical protein M3373_05940, partial [Gemmatimonadota bacterium]|nr:hypothetical protein [Gemmatimonadota bacterium]